MALNKIDLIKSNTSTNSPTTQRLILDGRNTTPKPRPSLKSRLFDRKKEKQAKEVNLMDSVDESDPNTPVKKKYNIGDGPLDFSDLLDLWAERLPAAGTCFQGFTLS